MNGEKLTIHYNSTINDFSLLSAYNYIFSSPVCTLTQSLTDIPLTVKNDDNVACFKCCIDTIASDVSSTEYTIWRLLYHINQNIATTLSTFVAELGNNTAKEARYIFYASHGNYLDNDCPTTYPRICEYTLDSSVAFRLTLSLDTTTDTVDFKFGTTNSLWFGIGIGPLSLGAAIIVSSDDPLGHKDHVAEWILTTHSTTPTPASVSADPNQNLISATFNTIIDPPPNRYIVECNRSYTLNQSGVTSAQFADNTSSIIIYAAWTTSSSSVNDHGVNFAPPVDILITPATPDKHWCNITACDGTANDCCIILDTSAPTLIPTSQPSAQPTTLPTTNPSTNPTKHPTHTPTPRPNPRPTDPPTTIPTPNPTYNPTTVPTTNPTHVPTADTTNPTKHPTYVPTTDPTQEPTSDPTHDPTADPTIDPTREPTSDPTVDPTGDPTQEPTFYPTHDPTADPTIDPTHDPTADPTSDPTFEPTFYPTNDPTADPTIDPTADPTIDPTADPTIDPTRDPTSDPSRDPTSDPTIDPTTDPTIQPTFSPTPKPTPKPMKKTIVFDPNPTGSPVTPGPVRSTTVAATVVVGSFNVEYLLYTLGAVGGLGVIMIIFGGLQFYQENKSKKKKRALRGIDIDGDGRADNDSNVEGFLLDETVRFPKELQDILDAEEEEEEEDPAMAEWIRENEEEMKEIREREAQADSDLENL